MANFADYMQQAPSTGTTGGAFKTALTNAINPTPTSGSTSTTGGQNFASAGGAVPPPAPAPAQPAPAQPQQPQAAPTATPSQPAAGADPFAAMGGGVQLPGGQWVPKDHPLAAQAGAAAGAATAQGATAAAPGGPQPITNAASALTAQVPNTPPTTVAGAFQQSLMSKLNQAPMDANNPNISGAISANRQAEQRGLERNRAMMAERAAAQGLDQNAFNSQLTGLAQESAGRQGQFEGNAVMQGARDQAQQLMQALSLGAGMLSQQDQLAMTDKLAQLQAQISREGIASQNQLGMGAQNIQRSLGEGQLNLGLMNTLLNNQQFGQNLGAQTGMFQAGLNSSNMLGLLNALG